MKSYPILLVCVACLAAGGCCGIRKQQIAALERENRQLDGMLWEMQFQVEALEDENADLKERLDETPQEQPKPAAPARQRKAPQENRTEQPESDRLLEPGEFRPPVIELPSDASPEGQVPDSLLPRLQEKPAEPQCWTISATPRWPPAPPPTLI